MSPKSTLSRFILALALAVSAVGLGGCAETTSGAESPSMARIPVAGARLASMTVPRVAPVAQETSHGSAYGYGSSGRSGGLAPSSGNNVR